MTQLPYTIVITESATKALRHVNKPEREQIAGAIDKLADNPRPHGVKSIVTQAGAYRIRVRDYRVLYEIRDDQRKVTVLKILHRSSAYAN